MDAGLNPERRVVITGVGIASPIGNNLSRFCQSLYEGKSGIEPLKDIDPDGLRSTYASQLTPLPEPKWNDKRDKRNSSQITAVTLYAAQQAVEQSSLKFDSVDRSMCGAIIGSGFHNLYDLEDVYQGMYSFGRKIPTMTIPKNMSSAPATRVAMHFGLKGIVSSVSTACSSGFSALRDAYLQIRLGEQSVVISGGSDLMVCNSLIQAWDRLMVTSRKPEPENGCQPFEQTRSGIVLGDGSAVFVLESLASARARGATVLAEIKAITQNSESVDLVKPQPEGEVLCMLAALNRAGLDPADIDLIFPHATGTKANDEVEYEALSQVFGESLIEKPICAIKSMIGHTMGASGPMSLAAALGSLAHGFVYPIPNLNQLEEHMALDVSTVGRVRPEIKNILINTFAFGGINVCLILSKPTP